MKNIIIGTAGHIDHGKTTLIKALTGRETDRWEEERRRGITIDLGFTYFDLSNGDRAGIIDVPGHERFVNHMVAGVIGMDLVLLVIAADEGIMPQTREHIDILGLLGLQKSIIILNKCDLVEEEWLELVEADIREEFEDTFFKNAPMVRVSSHTKQGIPELIRMIEKMTEEEIKGRDENTISRLPIDRVFTMSGFGTVITGTLLSGKIQKEEKLEVYPNELECRVRNIQVHGGDVDTCYAGQRVAINLSNVKKREMYRGCVLAPIGSMKSTMMLDVKLEILKSSKRVLESQTRLHLFTGTSEVLCRAVLLDKEYLEPGEAGYVQLRLETSISVRRGDKFIVRFFSPMETIGGGEIIDAMPTKKKRFDQQAIDEIGKKEKGSYTDVIELMVKEKTTGNKLGNMVSLKEIAKQTALSSEELEPYLEELLGSHILLKYPVQKESYFWYSSAEKDLEQSIIQAAYNYNDKNPYKYGIKKSEIRTKYAKGMKQNLFDIFMQSMQDKELLKREGEYLSRPDFTVRRDSIYDNTRKAIVSEMKTRGFDFIRLTEIKDLKVDPQYVDDILQLLFDDRDIIKLDEEMVTLPEILEAARQKIVDQIKKDGCITLSQVRDLLNTSRKSAGPLIEYFDAIKVTRRNGNERTLYDN